MDQQFILQDESHLSFIGGLPKLPATLELPKCSLCKTEQVFFFQVAFPIGHPWEGLTLAVFACISCADENYIIPQMLEFPLRDVKIPQGFLEAYQVNFRLLIFDTTRTEMRYDYTEKIKFKAWELVLVSDPSIEMNKIGGEPNWLLEDETPGFYDLTTPMIFLMQLLQDWKFETVANAPPQYELYNLPGLPFRPYYLLFNGNALYFWGTHDKHKPLIYVVTQID